MPDEGKDKKVVFVLFTGSDRYFMSWPEDSPNTTVIDLGGNGSTGLLNANKYVLAQLKKYVKKYGTVGEINFTGHGQPGMMFSKDSKNEIYINGILLGIKSLENELGVKITNRVVFEGCDTFSGLSNDKIKFYRDFAKSNDIEIVGSTSSTTDILNYVTGRFVQFTPKGEVVRDKLDTRYDLYTYLDGDDRSWVDYHLGKTQEEAEKAIKRDIITGAENLIKYVNEGDHFFSTEKRQLRDLRRKSNQVEEIEVLVAENKKSAVIISSDGSMIPKGNMRLHHLSEFEKTDAMKAIEQFVNNIHGKINSDDKEHIKATENTYGLTDGKEFRLVINNDYKKVLLVTERGGYETITIDAPRSTPNQHYKTIASYVKPPFMK